MKTFHWIMHLLVAALAAFGAVILIVEHTSLPLLVGNAIMLIRLTHTNAEAY